VPQSQWAVVGNAHRSPITPWVSGYRVIHLERSSGLSEPPTLAGHVVSGYDSGTCGPPTTAGLGRRAVIVGPIFWMELRTGARQARHYGTRAFVVFAILCFVVASWYSFLLHRFGPGRPVAGISTPLRPHELSQLGHTIFAAYSTAQFMLVVLLAPL